MNSSIQAAQKANNTRPPDLLVIPQRGITLPGEHLTEIEQTAVQADWAMFGNHPLATTGQTWLIQTWHIIGGVPQATSEITLPRQSTLSAPHPATHADNAASTPASSAPQAAG